MTVDHFRPKSRFPALVRSWDNLYYACSVCNSICKKDHPTAKEEAAGYRLVDPCAADPNDHFRLQHPRESFGKFIVRCLSPEATYSSKIFRFDQRKGLQDFWRWIGREEAECRDNLESLKKILASVRNKMRRKGAPEGLDRARQDLENLIESQKARIKDVSRLWSFPPDCVSLSCQFQSTGRNLRNLRNLRSFGSFAKGVTDYELNSPNPLATRLVRTLGPELPSPVVIGHETRSPLPAPRPRSIPQTHVAKQVGTTGRTALE